MIYKIKLLLYCQILFFIVCCKNNELKKATPKQLEQIEAEFQKTIGKMEVDSLKRNRMTLVNRLRPEISYHCMTNVKGQFFHLKLLIDKFGKAQEASIVNYNFDDREGIQKCIDNYFANNDKNFGILKFVDKEDIEKNNKPKIYTVRIY